MDKNTIDITIKLADKDKFVYDVKEAEQKLAIAMSKTKEATDKASDSVKSAGNQIVKSMKEGSNGTESMTKSVFKAQLAIEALKAGFNLAGMAIKAVWNASVKIAKTFIQMAIEGDKIGDVTDAFNKRFKNSTNVLKKLQDATGGTITKFELMQGTVKAMNYSVTKDANKLAQAWSIAKVKADELGVDVVSAYDAILRASATGRANAIKELGFKTDQFNKEVKMAKDRGIILSQAQLAQMLFNSVLKQGAKDKQIDIDAYEQLSVKVKDFKNDISEQLTPVLNDLAKSAMPEVNRVMDRLKVVMKNASDPTTAEGKAMASIKTALIGKDGLVSQMGKLIGVLTKPESIAAFGKVVDYLTKIVKLSSDFIDNWTWITSKTGQAEIKAAQQTAIKNKQNKLRETIKNEPSWNKGLLLPSWLTKANGGVIPGNSTFGDKVIARVNSGEMVLNRGQQANLFNLIRKMNTSNNINFNGGVNFTSNSSPMQQQNNFVNMLMQLQ